MGLTASTVVYSGVQIRSRQPLFDQLTVNVYAPGGGASQLMWTWKDLRMALPSFPWDLQQ